ncbi:DUF6239 family natural product biosynthesis protein [Actinosynnema sp. NPDC047251]|uniref:Putative secreted protein n=1 Tax=Saccharothrix espanaensis (strain ATCC 51144 / DSM 44229 / JCM 9112 / NBRC 15066 / NRRL 15764) TaxID=1179773 RepID=K0K207_SACES|nr:DUF6239 family natural product biosynthesis protein [Saccharothrix espanaensis]CCH30578.1 putative secreted protein [Saccharothrix espanaensis DSM 44229]
MHEHGTVALPLGFTILRLLLLITVTIVAGWALARPFTSGGALTRRVVTAVAAAGGVVALLVADATWLPGPAAVALIAALLAPPLLREKIPVLAHAVLAAVVLAAVATALWFAGPPLSGAHLVLMAGFAGVGWAALCPPTVVVRVVGAGLAVALLAGLAQVTLAGHLATPPSGPMLTRVAVAGEPVDVLVAPHRPGWNVVRVPDAPLRVGNAENALVSAEERPGASGRWALVWLDPGRGSLWLGRDGARATVPVNPGSDPWTGPDVRGPDGTEYADAALAALLAGKAEPPWPRLTDTDARALRAQVSALPREFSLVADTSTRSAEAAAAVRDEAARGGRAIVPDAPDVLVVGGEATGTRVHLAPWLRPPDLTTPDGRRYARVLADAFPGTRPTEPGLAAWRGDQTTGEDR